MKQQNRQTGRSGESLAAQALEQKGYTILEQNFANKFGEIDIIAEQKDTLIFVEVKTKIGTNFGLPEEMISKGKLRRVRNMATIYLNGRDCLCRIDVIAIVLDHEGNIMRLTHYENVY